MGDNNQREKLETEQLERLLDMINFLKHSSHNKFYQEKLVTVDPTSLHSLADLSKLPFTTKTELVQQQSDAPPFGNNLSYPLDHYTKFHQTSGTTGRPLRVLDTTESWEWWAKCWLEVYRAAGVNKSDRIFLAFSFGPFIGFWAAYAGAELLGALVIPGGGMDTAQRLGVILDLEATTICCTPSYALHMAEVAQQKGFDLQKSSVRVLILAGEPGAGIPIIRQHIETAWGAAVFDHGGGSEIGAYGFSCPSQKGMHLNESEFIAEVLDPASGTPVPAGVPGELVITNLGRWGYPVIRYRTHDIVQLASEPCLCGSLFNVLEGGIIGRTDNMIVVRGINVFPSSVEAIVREVIPSNEFRLIFRRVENLDELEVEVELDKSEKEKIALLEFLFRQRLSLRVPVRTVEPGALPRFQLKAHRIIDQRVIGS